MTYIVNDKCIKCKLMDCVEVCPVDCFYEGKNMLVIKPDECIDCGVCEPECPVDAIVADTEDGNEKWLEINKKYSEIWPNIAVKKDPPEDSDKFKDEKCSIVMCPLGLDFPTGIMFIKYNSTMIEKNHQFDLLSSLAQTVSFAFNQFIQGQ